MMLTTYEVICPRCGIARGERCVNLRLGFVKSLNDPGLVTPHRERIRARIAANAAPVAGAEVRR